MPGAIDVTDATFEAAVLGRSATVPVVVDLWAPWCGPCTTLGPILEKVVDATEGQVELVKVNIDENPAIANSFRVQSIPAVFAVVDGKVIDGFIGAVPEAQVAEFVARLAPPASEADQLVGEGDEASLRRALELEPDHVGAIAGLARILIDQGHSDDALALLARVPETAELRALAAAARLSASEVEVGGDVEELLDGLLAQVREDEAARQEFLDVLETLGPDDPRTARYRRALASRLF